MFPGHQVVVAPWQSWSASGTEKGKYPQFVLLQPGCAMKTKLSQCRERGSHVGPRVPGDVWGPASCWAIGDVVWPGAGCLRGSEHRRRGQPRCSVSLRLPHGEDVRRQTIGKSGGKGQLLEVF